MAVHAANVHCLGEKNGRHQAPILPLLLSAVVAEMPDNTSIPPPVAPQVQRYPPVQIQAGTLVQSQQTRTINNLGLTAPPARRLWPRRCTLHFHVQQSTVRISNMREVAHDRSTALMASANHDHLCAAGPVAWHPGGDAGLGARAAAGAARGHAPAGVRPEYPGGLPPPKVHCSLDSIGLSVMDLRVIDLPLLFQGFRVSDRRQCADTSCMCSSCPMFCSWNEIATDRCIV